MCFFAGPNTLVPRVAKVRVPNTPAVTEPRTAVSTTASFARFLDGAARGAFWTDGRRRDYWCWHVGNDQSHEGNTNAVETTIVTSIHLQPVTFHLRLHASAPSSQLCSIFLLPAPPQFLYQAPPGAQQLTRPDFLNMPQVGHVITAETTTGVISDVVIGVLAICHRASHS